MPGGSRKLVKGIVKRFGTQTRVHTNTSCAGGAAQVSRNSSEMDEIAALETLRKGHPGQQDGDEGENAGESSRAQGADSICSQVVYVGAHTNVH